MGVGRALHWGDKMRIVFGIVVAWVILSCTLGPALTWLFFYGERRARNRPERRARQSEGAELAAGWRSHVGETEAVHPEALLAGRRY